MVHNLMDMNLNTNLNIYVAGPFSVDATGESWDEIASPNDGRLS